MESLLSPTSSDLPISLLEAAKLIAALLEAEISNEETKISRSKHPAWEYFTRLDRNDAVCLLCSATVRSACSTNLSRHIVKHHPSTALQMRKVWLAGRHQPPPHASRTTVAAAGGVSSSAAPSAAIAAATSETMNCDPTDPTYPILVNPYSTAMMGQTLSQPLLTVGLGDLTSSWLPYQDLRGLDAAASAYETDLALGCPDLSGTPKYETAKFEQVKYDYQTQTELVRPQEKSFEETPRLYHKEEIKTEDDHLEKLEDKSSIGSGDSTPVKRGRPTENPCWNYFFRLDDQNVRCKLCSKVVKSACATNMTKHLERHHQHDYQHLIVQIRQYRSSKGPMMPPGADIAHVLANGYVKTEAYPDIYTAQTAENDLAGYSQAYESSIQDSSLWSRPQWGQWQANQPIEAGSALDTRSNGVIIHGSSQSWASTSAATPGSCGGEKPYMKRNRKTEHPVWEYFKRTQDGNAQCAICTGVVKSPCSSNFMRHLMRHHSSEYNNVYVKWVQKRGPGTPK